jgi:hypothetical protein
MSDGASPWRRRLGEFAVVVIGVLVALFVDGVREDLQERRTLADYLGDVAFEIECTEFTLGNVQNALPAKMESLGRTVALLSDPAFEVENATGFLTDLALSGRTVRPWLTNDRYQALRNSGSLRLLRDSDVSTRLADFYEAPGILFRLAEEQRGNYQATLNGFVPVQVADEMSPLRNYAGDVPIATVEGTPGVVISEIERLVQDVRDHRSEFLVELRREAAYGVAIGYALARYQLELEQVLTLLEPWRLSTGVPACARIENPEEIGQ